MSAKIVLATAASLLALAASPVHADLIYNFDPANTFSGTAPAGTLTVQFHTVSTGQVLMTITSNLATGENLDPGEAIDLNIVPALSGDLGSLNFALQSNTGFSQAASVQQGEDAFKADGDGFYDISVTYSPSTKAFTTGQAQTYLVTGTGITESSFDALSSPGGGSGPFFAAIHVQNTPSGGSGSAWVSSAPDPSGAVPEPASLTIFGVGLGVFGLLRRRLLH